MKRIVLTLALAGIVAVGGFAQSSDGNCYDEYYTLFRTRGAKKVTDGEQKLIIAIRKDNVSHCFTGKITVKNGEIVPPVLIEKADGTFEEFQREISPAFANTPIPMRRKIENGMTITFLSSDNETVKGFFIDFLADKPKANKVAPSAKSY